jgi:hypothetical protein
MISATVCSDFIVVRLTSIFKHWFVLCLILSMSLQGFTQTKNDDSAIKETIATLFRGMQLGDSAMARSAFSSKVTTARVFKDKSGNVSLEQEDGIADFMKAIGTPHKEVWYEEFWDLKAEIDGEFAQAWCDYAFYLGNTFSHCGIDAFQLYKTDKGWKIFHLADTGRKSGCSIPRNIQDKHK